MGCDSGEPGCQGPPERDRLKSLIATHGFTVLAVAGNEDTPSFAYTIGLTERSLPELLVIGIGAQNAYGILSAIVPRIEGIRDGAVLDDIAEGFRTAFVSLPQDKANADFTIQAAHLYGGDVRVTQVVWADPGNRLPWEPGCVDWMARMQSQVLDLTAYVPPPTLN